MAFEEFTIVLRIDHLFSASQKQYYVKQVLTKQEVTVEVFKLKKSMYDDADGFIFKHFDLYCNLIRKISDFDENLKDTAFKVLLQVSEKVVHFSKDLLSEESEEIESDVRFKFRNRLKMMVYLLCQFAHAFTDEAIKKTKMSLGKKGRKATAKDIDQGDWPEGRIKLLVLLKKLFQLPIRKLWSPPIIEYEFINFVTSAAFKLLENSDISKDKALKTELFRFLGNVLVENNTGLDYSMKILQLVQDYEHLSNVLADAVVYFVEECSADTLISEICREATLLDTRGLVQNLAAAHSLSQFLTSICERCPKKVVCIVGCLVEFLDTESHVMRNCTLSILGIIINQVLTYENMSEKDRKTREELLCHIIAHLLDVNSFVRCKAIQVLKLLLDEKGLEREELCEIGKMVTKRLKDKASNVRKNAMSFMANFVEINQFACEIQIPVLKQSYETENEKLKLMKKSQPFIFEDSDDEESENVNENECLIFNSDDEDENATKEKESETNADNNMDTEGSGDQNDKGSKNEDDGDEEYRKQQTLVNYLKYTLDFSEIIQEVVNTVCTLLHSTTQTDVTEAIDFFIAAGSTVHGFDAGIKEILNLVWSKDTAIKDAALNAFKNLYLSNTSKTVKDVAEIAKNLILLLKDATTDDVSNLKCFIHHFCKSGDIPDIISRVLWENFVNSASAASEEDKISILILIGIISEESPEFVYNHIDDLVNQGLGTDAENNFFSAMQMFKVISRADLKKRGKCNTGRKSEVEVRLSHDHIFVERAKHFLINGIQKLTDDQWTPMADNIISAIFYHADQPYDLCVEMNFKISETVLNRISDSEKDGIPQINNILLSRYLSFCGFIAIHYMTHLKVDHFAFLRRQEMEKEHRRRRSIVLQTPKCPKLQSAAKSKTKKRQSIHKSYELVPPVDEETTLEQILQICSHEVNSGGKTLLGRMLEIVVGACCWTLKEHDKMIQASASVALAKFMLLSEEVCRSNIQLLATIAGKSPEPYIRSNLLIALSDLSTSFPNIVEPWTPQIYQRLKDDDCSVRTTAIITLTHLILHDIVRVKSLVSEAAKCIADPEPQVADVAKYLFTELSKKTNAIYNFIPDIISSLSDPKSNFSEDSFQTVLRHMLQYVEKEKLVEGLVEKLCYRFTDSCSDIQLHELTFCLSILTLNDKCYSKLIEFKNLLKERMSDPIMKKYITAITANAKKNDAKTATELEAFRKELGI